MARRVDAEDIANLIEIAAGHRSWNGAVEIEPSGHLDLRQRGRPLDVIGRTEIAQRDGRKIHTPAEIPQVLKMEDIDLDGRNDPGLAQVVVILPPVEIAGDPRQVSEQADVIVSGDIKQASRKPVGVAQIMVALQHQLIGIERMWN